MRIAVAGATGMVGTRFVRAATDAGHDISPMSHSSGVDLFAGVGVHEALAGADVVVDLVQSPTLDEGEATHFFRRVAVVLGRAAAQAGVRRSVVLSVVACDRMAEAAAASFDLAGYYRAKLAHEIATAEEAPDPRVLRSAQLFDFVGQEVDRGRVDDSTTRVANLWIQPVDIDETVAALLEMATGADDRTHVQVVGPQREHLVDLATELSQHLLDPTKVEELPVGQAVRDGLLLPARGLDIRGGTFHEWLRDQPTH
jgi:dTDP-4-dehydrorhamnose reductase